MPITKHGTRRIQRLVDTIERKNRELEAAVKATYPLGCYVYATLGGHDVEGIVTGHGNWWYQPADVIFCNSRTGKQRRASATCVSDNLRKRAEAK